MRVVGIAIITALLSAGCAIQAGDPQPEETQRPNELVGISGGEEPTVNDAFPSAAAHPPRAKNGLAADSPRPCSLDDGSLNGRAHATHGQPEQEPLQVPAAREPTL